MRCDQCAGKVSVAYMRLLDPGKGVWPLQMSFLMKEAWQSQDRYTLFFVVSELNRVAERARFRINLRHRVSGKVL